ncbi:MAG TPA: hypothetical protein VMV48_11075 [Gallionellaceae bacterium]|nr:hypothetical protein [Gallionellaceae bacterium]
MKISIGEIMGIFGFFKSIRKKEEPVIENGIQINSNNSMPTIKPENEIFECYDEIFKEMISDISGLSQNEAKEINFIIKKCDGGFLNMGGYHSIVWEKYFKGRKWQWKEYEEWSSTFEKLGKFPSNFPKKNEFVPATSEDALSQLNASELKALCAENQLTLPQKAKKNDLIELLKVVPNITKSPLVTSKIDELNSRFVYNLYSLFMRTINFRGKSLYDTRRSEKIGVKKFNILHTFEEDREFVEMALRINPDALHPVFPSDMSIKKPIIDF